VVASEAELTADIMEMSCSFNLLEWVKVSCGYSRQKDACFKARGGAGAMINDVTKLRQRITVVQHPTEGGIHVPLCQDLDDSPRWVVC
jgi:hypothetical protein